MDKKIKIFVVHHREFWKHQTEIITPIHVGKKMSNLELDMMSDDAGENISHRNNNYCELTALYWAWKNLDLDYIGLFHYRRYLNLNPDNTSKNVLTFKDELFDDFIYQYGINDDLAMEKFIKQYDVILPRKLEFDETVEQQYKRGAIPHTWDITMDIIRKRYPDYSPYIEEAFSDNKMYAWNMFIMKYKIFHDYMEWLFSILSEADIEFYTINNIPQKRTLGYLSERLINLYLLKLNESENLRIKEVETVMIGG